MNRRVGTRFGGVILAAYMLLGVAGCGGGGGERAIEVGERAPDFSLVGLDGMRRSLASYRGQPLVLNFWATWCQPCHKEIPDLQELHRSGRIQVLSVAIDEQGEEIVRPFVEQWAIEYPVLIDDREVFASAYRATTIPYTLVLDAEHVIRKIYRIPVTQQEVLADLARLSSGVGALGP